MLSSESVKYRGFYCDIIVVNESCYKKRLNEKYIKLEQWQIRIKRKYDNMVKLLNSFFSINKYCNNIS